MKHLLLSLLILVISHTGFSQTWNFIGGSAGFDATEADIEISVNGVLYMACTDPIQNNKVTVRRWSGTAWQLVGAAGIGQANAFEMELVTTGDNKPAFAAKCMRTVGSTTYQSVEIYEWSGTAWVDRTATIGYAVTQHAKGISLAATDAGQLIFSFYSQDEQSNNFPQGAITVNLNTSLQLGGLIVDQNDDEYLAKISTFAASPTNVRNAFSYDDVGSGGTSYSYLSGGSWNRQSLSPDHAQKVKIARGAGSTNYSTMWMTNSTGNKLFYRSFNNATPNTAVTIATSSSVTDFDFDTYNDDTYFFYRNSTTCYFKKLTGSVNPLASTITSGTALAPVNATSLACEKYYSINVIAYISGGKCFVKEMNEVSNIEDWDNLVMCEMSSMTNSTMLYFLDSNYDASNNSLQVISTNTAVVPNSAISIFSTGATNFGITVSTTNDISSPTVVDLRCILVENGVNVDTVLVPLLVNPKPAISFTLPSTICENAPPLNLNNGVTPNGGNWLGQGVQGNYFNPGFNQISSPTNATFLYTKMNNYGCSAIQPYTIQVVPAPVVNVTVINSGCNQNNGAASLSINEGMSPYSVYWSNGSAQTLINQIAPGPYYVSVTDGNSCTVNQAVMVGSNGVSLSASVTNVLCYGDATGSIDATVSGGTGNLTYSWSNGSTTQDLQNVPAGAYELIVTNAQGCIATGSYNVTQPSQLSVVENVTGQATCGNDNGAAYITISGGAQPYTYLWFDADDNQLGSTSGDLEDVVSGSYHVQVTDNNGCGLQANAFISDADGPLVAIDTVITSSCSGDGEIQVINVTGAPVTYNWSNGASTEDLTGLFPGTYILSAGNSNGCLTVLGATVGSTPPQTVDICMVTVDTMTNTNLIVWEKPVTNAIDHFNIYRETSEAGVYQIAGSVAYADESVFNDLVASPSVRSWRYKISAVDDCGTESELSVHHKTIHLTMNLGLNGAINLIWDSYEGFPFAEFVVKRHTNLDGWITLQNMPVNLFTFTNTPQTTEGLMYLVTIETPETCTSTKSAQDYNSSRSNKDNRFSTGESSSLHEILAGSMKLYPNPSNGNVAFENNAGVQVKTTIIDASGRAISTFELSQGITQLDLGALSDGWYQVVYEYETIRFTQKLTIQH